ncbi:hypothetical protein BDW68DRAFT_177845 [Aspergillus falconensis]
MLFSPFHFSPMLPSLSWMAMILNNAGQATMYVIDPKGDAVIVLKNPNAPFAPLPADTEFKSESSSDSANADSSASPSSPFAPGSSTNSTAAEGEVRFLVSVADLIDSSPVFKRALRNNWKESLEYQDKGTVELTTFGWDTEAFLIFLNFLRWRSVHVAEDGSFDVGPELPDADVELTAKLVVLADYYNCLELLTPFYAAEPSDIISPDPVTFAGGEELRNQMLHLLLCWAFGWPAHFWLFSYNIIVTATESIPSLGLPFPPKVIRTSSPNTHVPHPPEPDKANSGPFTDEINRRRKLTLRRMVNHMNTHLVSYHGKPRCANLTCQFIKLGALTKFMHTNHILPPTANFTGVSIYGLKNAALAFHIPPWDVYPLPGEYRCWPGHVCPNNRSNMSPRQIFLQRDFPDAVVGLRFSDL